ncbi:chitin synthase-domain-containing protein [Chytriomyces cf. hyalinus JEL632]|nr:chitin synthase-domain-containing protein [Chytriomyces cf. hyalinus JEL632]
MGKGDRHLPEPTLPQIDGFLDEEEIIHAGDLSDMLRTYTPSPMPASGSVGGKLPPANGYGTNGARSNLQLKGQGSALSNNQTLAMPEKEHESPYDQMQYVSLSRKKTLTKPHRRPSDPEAVLNSLNRRQRTKKKKDEVKTNTWVYASWILTCCIPAFFISKCLGKPDPLVQQAYREKVALCIIIFVLMAAVGFLTFGFQVVVCPKSLDNFLPFKDMNNTSGNVAIHGRLYAPNPGAGIDHTTVYGYTINDVFQVISGADMGFLFPPQRGSGACAAFDTDVWPLFPCTASVPWTGVQIWPNQTVVSNWKNATARANPTGPLACHGNVNVTTLLKPQAMAMAGYDDVVEMAAKGRKVMIFSTVALDITPFFDSKFNSSIFGPDVARIVKSHVGKDATRAFASAGLLQVGQCMSDYLKIAVVDSITPSCFASSVIVWISLVIILAVVLARFVLALYFTYVIGWRLGSNKAYRRAMEDLQRRRREVDRSGDNRTGPSFRFTSNKPRPDLEGDIQPYNPALASYVLGGQNQAGSVHTHDSSGDSSLGAQEKSQLGVRAISSSNAFQQNRASSVPVKIGSTAGVFSGSRSAANQREAIRDELDTSRNWATNFGFMEIDGPSLDAQTSEILNDPTLMHTLCMVTAYSEGEGSLRGTLDSIANSYYPGTHKCLFVVADGIVKGSDNNQTTPDILIDMIEVDERFQKDDPKLGGDPEAYSYVAIADGANRKNYAKVYAGWYKFKKEPKPKPAPVKKPKKSRFNKKDKDSAGGIEMDELAEGVGSEAGAHMRTLKKRSEGRVPMILIVKVGNDEERNPKKPAAKPGNRGKRDSQVLLMNFLAKVMFDDRMTELEFDIFFKLFTITGVNPEKYEAVLMVDADTRIYPDALSHMIACLLKDDRVMGLCGETKISNKWDSWVTMIQVFEYFISHHMTKSFESVFGGCTCLPGCFSMYRIKTPKGPNGYWVPILANPDVVEEYSEHIVDSLHKKNLLLLGEDRFLSTMMLRTFPKRRMMFVPQAICKTVVPDTFRVLLSQRRRWINSTIHNLMELLLVKDLCGTFCISMQFVIFMELVGTVVLPAAITFTITIVIITLVDKNANTQLPLILLAIILGLPAILILFTANRPIYIFWMLIYLISLPVWNFILPTYAFWHFDDFSWGATRKVAGEDVGHDHSAREGEFDGKGINMKRWSEWVKIRRQEHERLEMERDPQLYEMKRGSARFLASSSASETGSLYGGQRFGGPAMSGSMVMPPMMQDPSRSSFFMPGPPPPGLMGMMPPPNMMAPPGLIMPGPPPPGLIMPFMGASGVPAGSEGPAVMSHPYYNAALGNGPISSNGLHHRQVNVVESEDSRSTDS